MFAETSLALEECTKLNLKRLAHVPKREDGRVALAQLQPADIGAIDADPIG
jgi:hypothetical protein